MTTAIATGIRYGFTPFVGTRMPLLFHTAAIAITAQIAGTVAGLTATLISAIAIDYFFIPPLYTFWTPNLHDNLELALFMSVGVLLSVFGGQRKRAAVLLESAYQRMALNAEVARLGTYEWFVKENRVICSPDIERVFGLTTVTTHEEWQALVHPDDLAESLRVIAEAKKAKAAKYDTTYRIVCRDGQIRWIHARRKCQYDAEGNLYYILGVAIDVTDLKHGEMAQQILGGLMRICSACRRIHDEKTNQWYPMEAYLRRHSTAKFSHGMCDECGEQFLLEDEQPSE